jgi:hypothetical protein
VVRTVCVVREDEPWALHLELCRESVEACNGIEAAPCLV